MSTYYPVDTSREQALEFRDHVRAREPFRLQMLARLLRDTGGPIEEMDASFASLVALWGWMIGFVDAGCPGVDRDVLPSLWVDELDGQRDIARVRASMAARRPVEVVGEAIDHYLRLTWDRFEPPTVWDIYISPPGDLKWEAHHHRTGLRRPGVWKYYPQALRQSAFLLDPDRAWQRDPAFLVREFARSEGWSAPPVQERGPSVLVPYLEADLGPIPQIAALSPMRTWSQIGPSERADWWPADADAMIVWRGTFEEFSEPERLGALDAERVAATLRDLGFVAPDGAALDAAFLLHAPAPVEDVIDLGHPDEAAVAQMVVLDGTIRVLQIDPVAADRDTWNAITRGLEALAKAENARLIKESHMQ